MNIHYCVIGGEEEEGLSTFISHKLILTKSGVDKSVYESGGKIVSGRVNVGTESVSVISDVGLVDVFWRLGLRHV